MILLTNYFLLMGGFTCLIYLSPLDTELRPNNRQCPDLV